MDTAEQQINEIIESTTQDIQSDNQSYNQQEMESNELESNSQTPSENFDNIEVFNVALHQYLKINEEIKALMEAVKERNKSKKQIAETLSTYLKSNQIKSVSLGGSYKGKKLQNDVRYNNTGFTKRTVAEAIQEELKEDEETFAKVMTAISNRTTTKEIWQIKLINEAKAKTKIDKASSKIKEAEALLEEE
jgi:hypothetical protein